MELLTTGEVARYLRLGERTVYDLAARGEIPCARLTGKLLFPRHLVDRWVESRSTLPAGLTLAPPLILAGSSDPLLDWAVRESECGLAQLVCGSGEGLRQMAEGGAMVAALHLFDAGSGGYNVADARAAAIPGGVVLIHWAKRLQGLMVARGNPLALGDLADLARRRPRFLPRQQGAGSQRLFEQLLAGGGIEMSALNILPHPARSESDLAAAIAEGEADCGIGIAAVAAKAGLDFIPLAEEAFEIALRRRDFFEPPVQTLLNFAQSRRCRERASQLAGYDIGNLGRVAANL